MNKSLTNIIHYSGENVKFDPGWIAFFGVLVLSLKDTLTTVFNRRGVRQDKREEGQARVSEAQITAQKDLSISQIEGAAKFRDELREEMAVLRIEHREINARFDALERAYNTMKMDVSSIVARLDAILARDGIDTIKKDIGELREDVKRILAAADGRIG